MRTPGLAKVQLTRTKGDQPVAEQERLYRCPELSWGRGPRITADIGGTEIHQESENMIFSSQINIVQLTKKCPVAILQSFYITLERENCPALFLRE